MQSFIGILLLISLVYAEVQTVQESPVYGYLKNIGVPTAERIRKAEENANSRIIGGLPAVLGQYPFKAGLIGDLVGLTSVSVCGGSLISRSRVLTAAHCWFDGVHQAWRLTAVLGSVTLFQGGTRVQSSAVVPHPNWSPVLARNDVAIIFFASEIPLSDTIAPIALPSGTQLFETFAGERAIAVGFGFTTTGVQISDLNHKGLTVIANNICSLTFPLVVQPSNICTSGIGNVGICTGDTGGPLIINRNNNQVLIGVAAFTSVLGCEGGLPSAFSRVTSFIDFINRHI